MRDDNAPNVAYCISALCGFKVSTNCESALSVGFVASMHARVHALEKQCGGFLRAVMTPVLVAGQLVPEESNGLPWKAI